MGHAAAVVQVRGRPTRDDAHLAVDDGDARREGDLAARHLALGLLEGDHGRGVVGVLGRGLREARGKERDLHTIAEKGVDGIAA